MHFVHAGARGAREMQSKIVLLGKLSNLSNGYVYGVNRSEFDHLWQINPTTSFDGPNITLDRIIFIQFDI